MKEYFCFYSICVLHRRPSGWRPRVTTRCMPSWMSSPSTTRSWALCCSLNCTISSTGAWSRTTSSWPAPGPTVWRTWWSLTEQSSRLLSGTRLVPACWIYLGLQSQLSKSFWLLCKGNVGIGIWYLIDTLYNYRYVYVHVLYLR